MWWQHKGGRMLLDKDLNDLLPMMDAKNFPPDITAPNRLAGDIRAFEMPGAFFLS